MQGLETSVNLLRRKVFAEVARIAFESEDIPEELEGVPYRITPTEQPQYRESVYRERAIASERVRLAIGLSMRPQDRPVSVANGLHIDDKEQYYEAPLMQVIPSACEKCVENEYRVSAECCRCLARSCVRVCPVNAVKIGEDGRSVIDREKCVRCGRCKEVCPYDAIVHKVRPCAASCGVDAIKSDSLGRAAIDPVKCVACGQCMVGCPFGAIADKSQIFPLVRALKRGEKIAAEIAPAGAGQFGATLGKLRTALKKLGFTEVYEVALGADMTAVEEAEMYAREIATGKKPFLLTSCCTSWRMLIERNFPKIREQISSTDTPMVLTAKFIKERRADKVAFIGPCPAKKLEAIRSSVRGDVDFVVTFEELRGLFDARGIDPRECEEEKETPECASAQGRGFASAGGVARAVEACVKNFYPGTEIKIDYAHSLRECRKILALAAHGKKDGYLIEGMACPGGCVAGAGVLLPVSKGEKEVRTFVEESEKLLPKS